MNKIPKFIIISIISTIALVLSVVECSWTQGRSYVTVVGFEVEGNKKTKEGTILRELDFQMGDSIPLDELANRLAKNQTLLLNTRLFYLADMNVKEWTAENEITIFIDVREAWYVYPIPIFELADRNFNVWWNQFDRSLARVNYGMRLYYINVTGRNDLLKAVAEFGFTRKYELEYSLPFINKKKTWGINTHFLFTQNKEIPYTTEGNDLVFHRNEEEVLLRRLRAGLGTTYRPGLYQKHQFNLSYYNREIDDEIIKLNSDFFLGFDRSQQYFSLSYQYQWDRRDIRVYPLNGHFLGVQASKEGLGFFNDRNALIGELTLGYFKQFGKQKKFVLSLVNKNRYQLIRDQPPYYNNKALGYEGDFIRGYEYYVVDGLDYTYLKTSLRYEILRKQIDWDKAMPFSAFKKMPFQLYFSLNSDWGYVQDPHYDEGNPLANEWLWGGGAGLDFVLYVDKVIRLEYSMNRLREKGVYLHYSLFF